MNKKSKGLIDILTQHFPWNKARLTCFTEMILALIKCRTVNLTQVANHFESEALVESRYKRIRRFFSGVLIDLPSMARWVLDVFDLQGPLSLSIDRTNWRWGQKDINILMLSVVYKGIGIPLLWSMLNKRGNSNTDERIKLIERFIKTCGKKRIGCLLADREFVGEKWFNWLQAQQIPFCIRIKKNAKTVDDDGHEARIEEVFSSLEVGKKRARAKAQTLWGNKVYASALRLNDGELLIVASDRAHVDAVALYGQRWQIETLFGCLKSKGFHFEDTHIVKPERISNLLVVLSVAFVWAHKVGEWRHQITPIGLKKHGRKAQSLFRYGLDCLQDLLSNACSRFTKNMAEIIGLLRPILREKTDPEPFQPTDLKRETSKVSVF